MAVGVGDVQRRRRALDRRRPAARQPAHPVLEVVHLQHEDVARARARPGALDLALQHEHRVARPDPDRPHASVLVEAAHLGQAEHAPVEGEGGRGIGDPERDVMDAGVSRGSVTVANR